MKEIVSTTNDGFRHFLDPVDMVACVAADTPVAVINEMAAGQGLRFPVYENPERTLQAHLQSMEYAGASSRFGPYVDNIPGMNWVLPSGRQVRIGERVVKSTTGFDLMRFLLHAGPEWGNAQDYVIRLRPLGGECLGGEFTGSRDSLRILAGELQSNSWNHWIDQIDYWIDGDQERIEVRVDCLPGESTAFKEWFKSVAQTTRTEYCSTEPSGDRPLPGLCFKSIPGESIAEARQFQSSMDGPARVLLLNGYVHCHGDRPLEDAQMAEFRAALETKGGHVFGNLRQSKPSSGREQKWVESLLEEWGRL